MRGGHRACRGRVINPYATSLKDRWAACSCGCPHDRGDGCLEYGRTHPPLRSPERA
ncbi:hypothetical protein [Nocardioides litoris]|uniref:hypothetical protein n=1 Tax=Nocardioides litoris TaxID=1926648 RepID=UPI00147703BF|nr:hypothetical protein [Nocardioides litoris]